MSSRKKKKKINVNPFATAVTHSFLISSHQSESRNFIEALTGKLPDVIWSFSHESWNQIDSQVKQSWVSEWCCPCLPSAVSASAGRIYHLLWPTTCHHTTLERHLSCEHSFLSDCLSPETEESASSLFILFYLVPLSNTWIPHREKHQESVAL